MSTFWRRLWRLKCQEKVKIFIWKLYHNFIPVGSNLRKRHITFSLRCPFCSFRDESPNHVFLKCWWSRVFWKYLDLDYITSVSNSVDMGEFLWYCCSNVSQDILLTLVYGLYTIWHSRNLEAHGEKSVPIEAAAINTMLKVQMFANPEFKFCVTDRQWDFSWGDQEVFDVIINCDASWLPLSKKSGFACVAKFSGNESNEVYAGLLTEANSVLVAESMALLKALQWAQTKDWKDCSFLIDSCNVLQGITAGGSFLSAGSKCLFKCASLLIQNPKWKLSVISREENSIADRIAKKVIQEDISSFHSVSIPPDCVISV